MTLLPDFFISSLLEVTDSQKQCSFLAHPVHSNTDSNSQTSITGLWKLPD